ncbi:unnamed protein product [Penicillium salamii]|uniref:Histone deacetylase complex subunit SAP30 Sin3 binding domain-containing protein n=1 Tax=Penicillium salamii TaxID=1612424 RepID=A0A9W4K1H6_9EURO|nr:unnamed protein product [Penicillium salamii]
MRQNDVNVNPPEALIWTDLEAEMTFLPKSQVSSPNDWRYPETLSLQQPLYGPISSPLFPILINSTHPTTKPTASAKKFTMAPPRQRTAAIQDDSRSEASSGTREYPKPKSRRPAKDKSITSAPVEQDEPRVRNPKIKISFPPIPLLNLNQISIPSSNRPQLPWADLPLEILHSYRHLHKLPTPSAFASDYSRIVLSQGVGLRSPTSLAARRAQSSRSDSLRRGQDRVSKDQFALVVRRHFNSAGLSEQETIARFLYTVREERRGRQFRLRFQP